MITSSGSQACTTDWSVGDLVLITHPNYCDLKGVIYQLYRQNSAKDLLGFSILTDTGENVIGWEPNSWHHLLRINHTDLNYTFTDVKTLEHDYKNGVFAASFASADHQALAGV